jgi:hypothetical protein
MFEAMTVLARLLGPAASHPWPFLLPSEQESLHLAAGRLRQFVDERDLTRIGMEREAGADMLLKFRFERVYGVHAGTEHDERLDDLGPFRVGLADNSDLSDGGMLQEDAFDIEWADAVARGRDYVVASSDEIEMSVSVLSHCVASDVPVTLEGGRVRLPVAVEEEKRRLRAMDSEDARRVGCTGRSSSSRTANENPGTGRPAEPGFTSWRRA